VKDDKSSLRLLTTPIYRFKGDVHDTSEGAVLVFAQGTDPELLLLLKVVQKENEREWQFGLARLTLHAIDVLYEDRPIWRADQLVRNSGSTNPYLTIDHQPPD